MPYGGEFGGAGSGRPFLQSFDFGAPFFGEPLFHHKVSVATGTDVLSNVATVVVSVLETITETSSTSSTSTQPPTDFAVHFADLTNIAFVTQRIEDSVFIPVPLPHNQESDHFSFLPVTVLIPLEKLSSKTISRQEIQETVVEFVRTESQTGQIAEEIVVREVFIEGLKTPDHIKNIAPRKTPKRDKQQVEVKKVFDDTLSRIVEAEDDILFETGKSSVRDREEMAFFEGKF